MRKPAKEEIIDVCWTDMGKITFRRTTCEVTEDYPTDGYPVDWYHSGQCSEVMGSTTRTARIPRGKQVL